MPVKAGRFRPWDTENKCWIHPGTIGVEGMGTTLQFRGDKWRDSKTQHIVISQFTGLTDKNGKEIYEGDILRPTVTGIRKDAEVKWDTETASFFADFDYDPKDWYELVWGNRVEVIGNIYENPELLV
jgi:uncharacterized phage protein (TIGR01671 family)